MSNYIPMLSSVTKETVQHYALNSGVICHSLDFEGITDAETFIAKVQSTDYAGNLLGATSGNTTIAENRTTWSPDHNGRRTPAVGEKQFDSAEPSLRATLVEMCPDNIKVMSGAADIEGDGTNAITIQPRATLREDDYLPNVVWFTNYSNKGVIGAVLLNAMSPTGLNWSIDDKKVATCNVEFRAHANNILFDDKLPIRYFIYLKSEQE